MGVAVLKAGAILLDEQNSALSAGEGWLLPLAGRRPAYAAARGDPIRRRLPHSALNIKKARYIILKKERLLRPRLASGIGSARGAMHSSGSVQAADQFACAVGRLARAI